MTLRKKSLPNCFAPSTLIHIKLRILNGSFVSLLLVAGTIVCSAQGTPTLSGNNAFTGNNTFANLNNIIYVDGVKFACNDVGLNAAIAAAEGANDAGGIVDASACDAATETIASTVNVGSPATGKPILLRLNTRAAWTCTITSDIPCWAVTSGSSIACPGAHGVNFCSLDVSSSANVSDIVKATPDNISHVASHILLDSIEVKNDLHGVISGAGIDLGGVYDTQLFNVTVGADGMRGLWIHDLSSTVGCNSIHAYGLVLDGHDSAGSRPLVIETTNRGGCGGIHFFGGDFGHPGSGDFLVEVNGHGETGLFGIDFHGIYNESNSSDGTTAVYKIADAGLTSMDGIFINRLAAGASNPGLAYSETAAGLTHEMTGRNLTVTGGTSCTNTITNSVPGPGTGNLSSCNVSEYVPLSSEVVTEMLQVGSLKETSSGATTINGNLNVLGTLTKSAGSFKIDHPLDPDNKYLEHSFVESPDMMNLYNGIAVLDFRGEGWVELPGYFEALNRDFRYQLTAIGTSAPGLYIAHEVIGNRFKIAGGNPGTKVSWQVTGIRHDAYADAHRIRVEEEKRGIERGHHLDP
jgi:hypothetical protein